MIKIHTDIRDEDKICPFKSGVKPAHKTITQYFKFLIKCLFYKFYFVGILRGKRSIPNNPKRIAVASGGNLGGAIISIPLIKGIREKWPNALLVIVTNTAQGAEIIKRSGFGDYFIICPNVSFSNALFCNHKVRDFQRQLLSYEPELFIGNFDFCYLYALPLKKIHCIVGQRRTNILSADFLLCDHIIDYDFRAMNWLAGYWEILKYLKISNLDYPKIEHNSTFGNKLLSEISPHYLYKNAFKIGIQASVWEKQSWKAWPEDKLIELCIKMLSFSSVTIIIFGSPGQDRLYSLLKKKCDSKRIINAVGNINVSELPDAISACDLVICNDSGLMHVSAAVGVATIALYGMTDYNITWVYDNQISSKVIISPHISPCYHHVVNVEDFCSSVHCIKGITVDFVFDVVRSYINEK